MTTIASRLMGLLFTQVTKPLGKVLGDSARNIPGFRSNVVKIGKIPYKFKAKLPSKLVINPPEMKPLSEDANKSTQEKPRLEDAYKSNQEKHPTDDEAYEIGAQFLVEILAFVIPAIFLVYEFRHIAKRDLKHDNAIVEIKNRLATQMDAIVRVDEEFDQMNTKLQDNIEVTKELSKQQKLMLKTSPKPTAVEKPKPEIKPLVKLNSIGSDSHNFGTIGKSSK